NGDHLWIGTQNGIAIYHIGEQAFKRPGSFPLQKIDNTERNFVINLFFKDEFERTWAFTNYGVVIYSGKDHSIISTHPRTELGLPLDNTYNLFKNCKEVSPGQIFLATYKGIKRIKYEQTGKIIITDEMLAATDGKEIMALNIDPNQNLWIATADGLLKKNLNNGSLVHMEDVNLVDQKKWTNSINTIYFDNNSNLWLGTLPGFAIATKANTPFISYFQSADLKTKIDRATFIFPVDDSTEYACAVEGFYRVDNPGKKIQRLKEGYFCNMFRHADGNFFVAMHKRFFVFRPPNQFIGAEKIYPELDPVGSEAIMTAVNWNDSLLFLGSEDGNGVFEWNYKKKTLANINDKSSFPFKGGVVNAIYKDKLNRIWILSDNSFAVYNPYDNHLENHELRNPVSGKPLTLFFDMCEASGFYWMASYGLGILQLDNKFGIKSIISTSHGMNNAGVYKIFSLNDTLLLSTSNNGLSKINTRNFSVTNYFESDGLHSNAFEEFCGTAYNGKIYAGGPYGFTIINAKELTGNAVRPVLYISNIVIATKTGQKETTDLFLKSATFPRDILQATVYFSGINYFNPELTTYSYRIKGQHSEWVKLGTQNFVNLTGLKPDKYTLQVQAFNEDGMASEVKEIQLVFLPKWYQTNWFKVLLVLLVAGIVYALYKIRINQLKKEREIRTHLASDLHDDLGSTLNSVKVYANMAMLEKENHSYLEKVKESTQEAITGVRDIIWVLDDKKDLLDHLLTRIKSFAAPLCEAHQVTFHQHVNDSLLNYKLGKEEKRNLYMIIKEAVNNSVKYAKGKSISLTIEHTQNIWTIKVADDGIGFEKDKITEGNGLKNIMNRAIEIGYKATIISQPGHGTTIQLEKN
ncbi:MAG TPA: ATP-binding protein, partial [Chitinophagaceae bacterium]|nr:ATP-binding protein [Chitinophagaceae bacterium]